MISRVFSGFTGFFHQKGPKGTKSVIEPDKIDIKADTRSRR